MTMADWSPAEDRRPGHPFQRTQPEKTGRGDIYTFVVTYRHVELKPAEPDMPCYTQMQIRDCSGQLITTHGRVYSPPREDDAA